MCRYVRCAAPSRRCAKKRSALALRRVLEARRNERCDTGDELLVDGRVVVLALGTADEQARLHQELQVMRNRGLRDVEALGELTARELAGRGDLLDHAETRRIGERLQRADDVLIADFL